MMLKKKKEPKDLSCSHATKSVLQFPKINSSENSEYVKMTSIIGIPQAPVLEALSESVTLVSIFS